MSGDLTSPSPASPNGEKVSEQVDAPKSRGSRKRQRRRHAWRRHAPILTLLGLLILGWVLYGLVWPPLEIRHKIANARWKIYPNDPEISVSIRIMLRTCEYLYCFWFFYLGASIGSFINVVANRVPRGVTIVSRGSHCPYCDSRLSLLDNTPVFGWVALRGRCRACHLPIAPRYLIMELVVGAIFMILAVIELMGNGMNLPYREWRFSSGIVYTVFYPKWDLIGTYVIHASLFAIAVMLIGSHMDRLRFPSLPLWVIGAIYIACSTFQPLVAPIRWIEPWGPTYTRLNPVPWERLQTSIIGLFAGTLIGLGFAALVWFVLLRPKKSMGATTAGTLSEASPTEQITEQILDDSPIWDDSPTHKRSLASPWFFHSIVIFLLAGLLLGWQVVFNVGLAASLITLLVLSLSSFGKLTGLSKDPFLRPQVLALAILTITLLLHHLFWRQLALLPFLPFRSES